MGRYTATMQSAVTACNTGLAAHLSTLHSFLYLNTYLKSHIECNVQLIFYISLRISICHRCLNFQTNGPGSGVVLGCGLMLGEVACLVFVYSLSRLVWGWGGEVCLCLFKNFLLIRNILQYLWIVEGSLVGLLQLLCS